MQKVKLFFTRRSGEDDIIQFYDDETYLEMVRVVYTPGDHSKRSNEFFLTRRDALSYATTTLRSLEDDVDPFEFVQIQTAIHPSIMVSVMDVSTTRTLARFEDMIYQALKATVEGVKLKRTVRSPTE